MEETTETEGMEGMETDGSERMETEGSERKRKRVETEGSERKRVETEDYESLLHSTCKQLKCAYQTTDNHMHVVRAAADRLFAESHVDMPSAESHVDRLSAQSHADSAPQPSEVLRLLDRFPDDAELAREAVAVLRARAEEQRARAEERREAAAERREVGVSMMKVMTAHELAVEELANRRKWLAAQISRSSVSLKNDVGRDRISALTVIPMQDCPEVILWENEVVMKNVQRDIMECSKLVVSERQLVAELRWLHLLVHRAPNVSLQSVVQMRTSRGKTQNDLEVPYHPLIVLLMAAAAEEALPEVHAGDCRPDAMYKVKNTVYGQEAKATFALGGIDKNSPALGKLYKIAKSCWMENPCRDRFLVLFFERIELVWLVMLKLDSIGCLELCEVSPDFPLSWAAQTIKRLPNS